MVSRVVAVMNHWMPVKRSFMGLMGTIVVLRPGWKVTRRRSQIRMIEMIQTGSAMKNQMPQPGAGFMFWSAIKF